MSKADFRTPAPKGSVVFACHAISGEDLRVQRPGDHPQGGPFLGHLVSRAVSHFKLDPLDLIFITDDGLMLDPRDSLTWDDFHTEFYKKINEEKVAARQEKREWQIFEDTEPAQLLGDHMQHSFRTPGCIEEARKVALDLEDCCGFVHWNGQYFFKRRENNDGLPEMIEHDNKKITFHYVAPPSSNVSNSTLSRNSNEEQVPLAIFFFLKSWLKVPEHMMTNSMSMASSAQMGMASSGMLAQHFPVEHVPAPQVPGICSAKRTRAESSVLTCNRLSQRLQVQLAAAEAVKQNLQRQVRVWRPELARFQEKWARESAKWNKVLEGVPAALDRLKQVELHESIRKEGQKTLMDVIPVQLVKQSADKLKNQMEKDEQSLAIWSERSELTAKKGEERLTAMDELENSADLESSSQETRAEWEKCNELINNTDNPAPNMSAESSRIDSARLSQADSVGGAMKLSSQASTQATGYGQRPQNEFEAKIFHACDRVEESFQKTLHVWQMRCNTFLQRLREISTIQTRLNDCKKRCLVLEEGMAQNSTNCRHLSNLEMMPRAYEKTLLEVAKRKQFAKRYTDHAEQTKKLLDKMRLDEMKRRDHFHQKWGKHMPKDFLPNFHDLVPECVIHPLPPFDKKLPDIGLDTLSEYQQTRLKCFDFGLDASVHSQDSSTLWAQSSTAGKGDESFISQQPPPSAMSSSQDLRDQLTREKMFRENARLNKEVIRLRALLKEVTGDSDAEESEVQESEVQEESVVLSAIT